MLNRDNRVNNDAYFGVLCDLAGLESPVDNCGYFEVMNRLYHTEFYWTVPNDDNRASDGLKLREKYGFVQEDLPCNLLEMFLALAIRCDDEIMYNPTDGDRHTDWFWMMMTNLGLSKYRDRSFGKAWGHDDITDILDIFMERRYGFSGHGGGLFPLKDPRKNQTDVEIWYQLSTYLLEHPELEQEIEE
jgi:hypothetical protein